MQTFKLTIFRQSRVLFGLFLLPFAFTGLLLLGLELGSFIWGLLLFVFYLLVYYYFTVGQLTISIDNERLHFSWTKKIVFNYKEVADVNLADIKTIVIDNGQFLRKLITDGKTVYLNTTKVKPQDNFKLIGFLQAFSKNNNVRVINSWREWADKGYLKTAYRINIAVIAIAFVNVAIFIARKGFSSGQLFIFLLFIPQLILYGQQMKLEIKNNDE
ncbi:hypothetical protein QWZ08_16335 [Ferruginibacter paludis]|uniref:hypothetical protein n=1 Tax=Ferruginibacter paludis TaxID=1310417 RepID=UPI0025B37DA0|nr:hypothetical protein [Ferruginibacter paludis]MDN3657219.1 hypothetical protein [Ferruginibacter paludis]